MAKARQGMTNYLATRVILLKTPGSGRSENLQMFPNLWPSCVINLNLTAPADRPIRTLVPPGQTNRDAARLSFPPIIGDFYGPAAHLAVVKGCPNTRPCSRKLDAGGHPHEFRTLGERP